MHAVTTLTIKIGDGFIRFEGLLLNVALHGVDLGQ